MMREKRRYILVECSREIGQAEQKGFETSLQNAMIQQLGEAEYYLSNPKIVKFIGERSFILVVFLQKYEESITALALIKNIGSAQIGLYTTKSSGTIKALLKK